jgi:hypothetical protein
MNKPTPPKLQYVPGCLLVIMTCVCLIGCTTLPPVTESDIRERELEAERTGEEPIYPIPLLEFRF